MKKHIDMLVLCAVALFSLTVSIVFAHASQPDSTQAAAWQLATAPWYTIYVHRQVTPIILDVGKYNSVAFNPKDGLPYISYYNATNHTLMLASPYYNGGSSCGVNGDWWCRTVDGDGVDGRSAHSVGQYSSIAFWSSTGQEWKMGFSYYDATVYGLRYAVWSCNGGWCSWDYAAISSGSSNFAIGWYTSLQFDSFGNPHIAYYASNNLGADDLYYTTFVGGGTGNCGPSNNWDCRMVDSGAGVGKYASLSLSYDGMVYIAYYHEGLSELRYAYDAGFGNCGDGNTWSCQTIDAAGHVGQISIVAPGYAGDVFHVAYYDADYHQLKYAQSGMGNAGNCGPSNSWQCDKVDDMDPTLPVGISMKLDPDGYPMIAYQYKSTSYPQVVLRIARPYLAYGDSSFGNCGDVPPGYLFQYWRCTTLDDNGQYYTEGDFVSLAINGSGLAVISYAEEDLYYSTTGLKVAYQRAKVYLPVITR
jgi:hypothetical protein